MQEPLPIDAKQQLPEVDPLSLRDPLSIAHHILNPEKGKVIDVPGCGPCVRLNPHVAIGLGLSAYLIQILIGTDGDGNPQYTWVIPTDVFPGGGFGPPGSGPLPPKPYYDPGTKKWYNGECPAGQHRDPATGQCVGPSGGDECPPGLIKNPLTGYCDIVDPNARTMTMGDDFHIAAGDTGNFTINTDIPFETDHVIVYEIVDDSTAVPGTDYTALSGSITLPAGALSVEIPVETLVSILDQQKSIHLRLLAAVEESILNPEHVQWEVDGGVESGRPEPALTTFGAPYILGNPLEQTAYIGADKLYISLIETAQPPGPPVPPPINYGPVAMIAGQFIQYAGNNNESVELIDFAGNPTGDKTQHVGCNGSVFCAKFAGPSKIYLGGDFTTYNGIACGSIVRINRDGSFDDTFQAPVGLRLGALTGKARNMVVQSDGRVIVVGDFDSANGVARRSLVRFNLDGSVDTGFAENQHFIPFFWSIDMDSSENLYLGGFTMNENGGMLTLIQKHSGSTGHRDTSWNSPDNLAQHGCRVPAVGVDRVNNTVYYQIGKEIKKSNGTNGSYATFSDIPISWEGSLPFLRRITIAQNSDILVCGELDKASGRTIAGYFRATSTGVFKDDFIQATQEAHQHVRAIEEINNGDILVGGGDNYLMLLAADGTLKSILSVDMPVEAIDINYDSYTTTPIIPEPVVPVSGTIVGQNGYITEGQSLDFIISRTAPGPEVIVTYTIGGTAINGTDYDLLSGIAIIPEGELNLRTSLQSLDQGGAEANETAILTLEPTEGYAIAEQPDNQVTIHIIDSGAFFNSDFYLFGNFTGVKGNSRIRAYRPTYPGLNTSPNWTTYTGANGVINRAAFDENLGKIYVVGNFTTYQGAARGGIARINIDGSLDTTFAPTGADGEIRDLVVDQVTGQVTIVGKFANVNGTGRIMVARLNSDGTLDLTFTSPYTGPVVGIGSKALNAIALAADGKIYVGGEDTSGTTWGILNRLTIIGAFDTYTNSIGGASGFFWVNRIKIVVDAINGDQIWVARSHYNNNGPVNGLVKLTITGSAYAGFTPVVVRYIGPSQPGYVYDFAIQSDGKIIIVGSWNVFNGAAPYDGFKMRVNANGTTDVSYNQNAGQTSIARSVAILPSGGAWIGTEGGFYEVSNIGALITTNFLSTAVTGGVYNIISPD